jgi:hypothetical protein
MHVAVLMVVAVLGAPAGDAHRAAQLEAWGDLPAARAEVEAALGRDPKDPTARLVAACVALEEERLEVAEEHARWLERARAPQGKVLLALVERRRRLPEESLRDAIAPAWKAAGRPDLSGSPLAGIDDSIWSGADNPGELSRMAPGERVVFGAWARPEGSADALAASLRPEANPVSVNLSLLWAVRRGDAELNVDEAAAVARVGRVLSSVEPENGYWDFVAWEASGPRGAPLTVTDLDRLERQAGRPRFELPRDRLMLELRTLAERFDPEHARCQAGMAALGIGAPLFVLGMRAEATSWDGPGGAELKARTGRVMIAIGGRLASSRTYLERIVGVSLVTRGARLSGEPQAIEAAERTAREERDRYHRALEASRKAGTWPFSSDCRDWSPDEVTFFERYLD